MNLALEKQFERELKEKLKIMKLKTIISIIIISALMLSLAYLTYKIDKTNQDEIWQNAHERAKQLYRLFPNARGYCDNIRGCYLELNENHK